MTLVDTSVWVDHFRNGNGALEALLHDGDVMTHPFVVGELACGSLRNRAEVLRLLKDIPDAPLAEHNEVMQLVERKRLWSQGIGWIDAHLIASALLAGVTVWSMDRRLSALAERLHIAR